VAQSGTFASRNRRHFAHANTLFPTWAVLDRITRRTAARPGLRSAYGSLMTIQDLNSDFVEPANTELIARRAVRAAYFGFFVDMFEVYLPIAVLAPALEYFIPAGLSAATKATIFAVVFAISLMGRPLGSLVFGHFGDRIGRRRITLISVAGFAVATLLIAALPGYAMWGGASIAALLALRFVDGIFVGGEYTAANPLAMEYSYKEKRGLNAALIHVGYPAALVCVSLLTASILKVAPGGGAGSAYAVWGWRIPFAMGALLAGALFFYYYFMVPESEVWRSSEKSAAPLKEIFAGADLRRLGQLIVVMSGAWLTLDATVAALPGVINTVLGVKSPDVNTGILIGAAISVPIFPLMGILSQKFGRRPMIAILGLLDLLPASALYYALVAGAYRDSTMLIGLVALILVLTIPVWAVITPYLTESFRTEIRSSGYGVSYSLATILPGLYSFYMLGLAKFMPYEFSPIVLLALGGLLLSLGALAGPETKHVDFNR
jgi:MFS family permease